MARLYQDGGFAMRLDGTISRHARATGTDYCNVKCECFHRFPFLEMPDLHEE